jgi:RING finger family protein
MSAILIQRTAVCQICFLRILDGDPFDVCPSCATPFHRDCWEEIGGCAVYGCPHMFEARKADGPIAFWGTSEKVCPMCAETIPVAALECPQCKMAFDDIRPLSREEALRPKEDPALRRYRRRAGWLLFFSAIGCTSPLALLIGGIWYLRERETIALAGPTVRGVILISFMIALVYLIALSAGWVVFHFLPPA